MHEDAIESRVPSAGGVELAVREIPAAGADGSARPPAAGLPPTLVLVHGYPDTQDMWDSMVGLLHDRHGMSVVTYDVRGSGASTAPTDRAGYRTERLVDDLVAVLDAVRPGRQPVHLVGHDWGSVQLWDVVADAGTDPRLQGRIASFTSISGPSLDSVARFARHRELPARLSQALRSWYVAAFQVPLAPELILRVVGGPLGRLLLRRGSSHAVPRWGPTLGADAARGVELYRANVRRRMRSPRAGRTDVPVLTVVPTGDAFLSPALFDDLAAYAPNGRRVDIDAGHWAPCEQPELVADLVVDWVREHADRAG